MRRWKKPAMLATAAVLVMACAACAPQGAPMAETGALATSDAAAEVAAEGAVIETGNHSWEQWQSQYPDQYATFIRGIDDTEAWDGKVHGHAALYFNTPVTNYGGRNDGR